MKYRCYILRSEENMAKQGIRWGGGRKSGGSRTALNV